MIPLADKLHVDLCNAKSFPQHAYDMRATLRKAQKFVLDAASSAKISDFSLAIAEDLDGARQAARPPYPVTWIEFDNLARFNRATELNIKRTINPAFNKGDQSPIPRVGWLIERHPTQHSAYKLSHVGDLSGDKVFVTPWSWIWDVEGGPSPWEVINVGEDGWSDDLVSHYHFGVNPQVSKTTTWFGWSYGTPRGATQLDERLASEFAGELRNAWGLLVALGALPSVDHAVVRIENPNEPAPPVTIVKDKPVQPFVIRQVTLRIPRLRDINKVVTRCIEGARKRRHGVRGHWRHYRNADGDVVRKVWIQDHERGDESLGRVEHSYRVIGR